MERNPITPTEYRAFQDAYEFFNRSLFSRSLPDLLITFQRHANTRGYFAAERFAGRRGKATAHELAMNPDTFNGRNDQAILSTLAHEMAHVWQQSHGTPPRRSYHDREWAAKMKEIGLQPTDTGEPGGKETGQKVTHYVIPGGKFAQAYAKLAATGFRLNWQSRTVDQEARAKKAASKTKFTCASCELNAWAKPDASLVCGDCMEPMRPEQTQKAPETAALPRPRAFH